MSGYRLIEGSLQLGQLPSVKGNCAMSPGIFCLSSRFFFSSSFSQGSTCYLYYRFVGVYASCVRPVSIVAKILVLFVAKQTVFVCWLWFRGFGLRPSAVLVGSFGSKGCHARWYRVSASIYSVFFFFFFFSSSGGTVM